MENRNGQNQGQGVRLTQGLIEIMQSIRDKAYQKAQQSGNFERAQRINDLYGEVAVMYMEPPLLRRQMD